MPSVRPVVSGKRQAARENRHWTDDEYDARVMRCLVDDALACACWRTVWGGLGLAAIGAVLVVLVMSW